MRRAQGLCAIVREVPTVQISLSGLWIGSVLGFVAENTENGDVSRKINVSGAI
jgi:hypothetical protein